jgi:general secretion pathway protein A
MHEAFFGLKEKPFSPAPNPRYLYLSPSHRQALAHLVYGLREKWGFIALLGEVGTGKTTLLHTLLAQREHKVKVAFVSYPKLTFDDLLLYVLDTFGLQSAGLATAQRLRQFQHWLMEEYSKGEIVVLVIDEAQNLSIPLLEDIRMLSNLETAGEKLLQIVLVGQPELQRKLRSPHLRQLQQRIGMAYTIRPLSGAETQAYIAHRCAVAGGDAQTLFTRRACKAIYAYSGGIPRLINTVASQALLTAYAAGRRRITRRMVRHVRHDLETWRRWRWRSFGRRVAVVMAALVLLSITFYVMRGRSLLPIARLVEPEAHRLASHPPAARPGPLPQEEVQEKILGVTQR